MENILTDKERNLRFIKWCVVPSTPFSTVISDTFLFQNRNCTLDFYTGSGSSNYVIYPYLYFKCDGQLQLPVLLTLHVDTETGNLADITVSMTSANQIIWSYTEGFELINQRLVFELIFHNDCSKSTDDKSVQTPSYIDNCFLMDGASQDFSRILSECPWRDLEFICGDESIKAHKSVVSCRSDVFASMLESDMVEGKTGRVNIQDMDPTLFRQFLKCLYTGVLPSLTVDNALHFYEAGDKYNIISLKKQCADFLVDNLLTENAYDVLILADRHSDSDFKKNVIDFMMKEHMPYSGENWTYFCKKNPILANEVLNLFCQHLRPK